MAEAIPGRPGHVGYSPQSLELAQRRARRRGLETSGVVAALIDAREPRTNFLGGATHNPQRYGRVSVTHSLAAADEFARREHTLAPWQEARSKWPLGYLIGRLPLPIEQDREQVARPGGFLSRIVGKP